MSILKTISDARTHYHKQNGMMPDHLHLAPGLLSILRNELNLDVSQPLRELMGMKIVLTPAIQVNNAPSSIS